MTPSVFAGWYVVAGAFAVLFVAYGAQYSFGVFFSAMLAEFGWSRASLAGAFSLYALGYCILGFVAGKLTDRWGPRVVIATGGVFLGVALLGMSQTRALWQPYVLYGVVASVGMATAFVPTTSTVVRWFVRRRGLALGITTSGQSAGMLVLPLVAQWLVSGAGWRTAYAVFGTLVLAGLVAVAPAVRRDPESAGLRPDGDAHAAVSPVERVAGVGLAAAMHTRAFWMLLATFTATWIPVFVPIVHAVPLARDLGLSAGVAASLVPAIGVGAVPGRLLMGLVSDVIGRRAALAIALSLQAIAFVMLAAAGTLPLLYAAAFVFGYSYGAITALFSATIGDLFGGASSGSLVGFFFAVAGGSAAIGPVVAGAVYDATGAYTLAFVLAATLNLMALATLAVAR